MAIFGMWPSLVLRGSRVRFSSVIAVVSQDGTFGTLTWRRHLPTCTTSGMLLPVGTPSSRNLPSASVSAVAIGLPEIC